MRNLKKFLALVLAMVMAFSLMMTASATDYYKYGDTEEVTAAFEEAVNVLSGLNVLKGDNGNFKPGSPIMRCEVAAIMYRIATGDVNDNQVGLYADYSSFDDVNPGDWFAGYVSYCEDAGIIRGKGANRFDPYGNVTGYEMLVMLLRAVGYNKEAEFTTTTWKTDALTKAEALHITDNVKEANFLNTLNQPARRDVVADLAFQTMVLVPTVDHNAALGYTDRVSLTAIEKNPTLGQKIFGLYVNGDWVAVDNWGTPGYRWYQKGEFKGYNYQDNAMQVWGPSLNSSVCATIKPAPSATYEVANVHECDVAKELGIDVSQDFNLWVNQNNATDKYKIVATDTVTRVGGQGRETKVWYDVSTDWSNGSLNWVTMKDTYLAKVTRVIDRVVDPAGHEIVAAKLYLDVYDGPAVGESDLATASANYNPPTTKNTSAHIAWKSGANWDGYAVGDMVLVNGISDLTQANDGGNGATAGDATGLNHTYNQTTKEEAAFETNILKASTLNNSGSDPDRKLVVSKPVDPIIGKQSALIANNGKHIVNENEYEDAMTLFLDVAGNRMGTTYAWYLDGKGNLIGIDYVPDTVHYGIITDIWTAFGQGDTDTNGLAKTYAKVLYANGETDTITIDKFVVTATASTGAGHLVSTTSQAAVLEGTTSGTYIELTPAYDYSLTGTSTMRLANKNTSGPAGSTTLAGLPMTGDLPVAPVSSINTERDGYSIIGGNGTPANSFGIVYDNLYKFQASADGEMTVIEVAGNGVNSSIAAFAGFHNIRSGDNSSSNQFNKLYKSLGYITTTDTSATSNTGTAIVRLDNSTRIMINDGDGTGNGTVKCYTLASLPGNVTITASSEIDWTDVDNDGRAEYVYLYGSVDGLTTYGLFYFNGGVAARWDGTTGTLSGWLNGEAATVTFDDWNEYYSVLGSSQTYAGHLFALKITDGVVEDVLTKTETSATVNLLQKYNTGVFENSNGHCVVDDFTGTNNVFSTDIGGFQIGTTNGNPYGTNTRAVYFRDDATNNVVYNTVTSGGTPANTITAGGQTFYITPATKVYGLGMTVTQESAIYDYLNHSVENDVTIIYDNTGVYSIVEIYIATDPNNTPNDNAGTTLVMESGKNGIVETGTTTAGLVSAIKSGPGTVIWPKNLTATESAFSDCVPKNCLFIPTGAYAANAAYLKVDIYEADGTLVYSEGGLSQGTAPAINNFIYVDFQGSGSNSGITYKSFTAGDYYCIVTATNTSTGFVNTTRVDFTLALD